jgi:uncharacterized protein YggE
MEEQAKKCDCDCGDNCKCGENCNCGCKCCLKKWLRPKYTLTLLVILGIIAIVIVSILRDRIVNQQQNQVSVTGQGKISYQPDIATITLGVQVDKASTAEAALNQMNDKINKIIAAVGALGIKKEDVTTAAYTLSPQYDYANNVTTVSGYNANQKLAIKVYNIQQDKEIASKIISAAGQAGTNQVLGVDFSISNINDLKQQARILAIQDAKSKSAGLAKAAGVKLGKIEGWYENIIQPIGDQSASAGYGGMDTAFKAAPSPQVPSGTQDVIVEVSLNYEVK